MVVLWGAAAFMSEVRGTVIIEVSERNGQHHNELWQMPVQNLRGRPSFLRVYTFVPENCKDPWGARGHRESAALFVSEA